MNSQNRAVQFGNLVDKGRGPNTVFPFFYSFIPRANNDWSSGASLTDNLKGIGITVTAGATVQHFVVLDRDYNFKLFSIKYKAFYVNTADAQYEWYESPVGWFYNFGDYQTAIGTPLTSYLNVSVSVEPSSRYILGGSNTRVPKTAASTLPLDVQGLQGYDYGIGQVRTPYFMPRGSMIRLDITNSHATKDFVVCGILAGVKARI